MWHEDWNGLPSEKFLVGLDPLLAGFRERLFTHTETADKPVGRLTPEWAERLGLTTGVVVAGGAFDCHFGAVGAEVTPRTFVRVIGTSTCDIMVASHEEIGGKLIKGICGQVDGSVIPGMIGLEAGQSAFGDIYAWFRNVIAWPLKVLVPENGDAFDRILPFLSAEAAKIPAGETDVLAVDWMNGRRTPDANQRVRGTITGLDLSSTAPRIFRALVEATAYGSRAIMERFRREGVEIKGIIGLGGVAKKSEFAMQTMADVMNMKIRIARSEQTCAMGAAMFAAVVAGIYPDVQRAQAAMGQGFEREYTPREAESRIYDRLYRKYLELGAFTESLHDNTLC
jgi:L-ribulokinase